MEPPGADWDHLQAGRPRGRHLLCGRLLAAHHRPLQVLQGRHLRDLQREQGGERRSREGQAVVRGRGQAVFRGRGQASSRGRGQAVFKGREGRLSSGVEDRQAVIRGREDRQSSGVEGRQAQAEHAVQCIIDDYRQGLWGQVVGYVARASSSKGREQAAHEIDGRVEAAWGGREQEYIRNQKQEAGRVEGRQHNRKMKHLS